MSRLEYCLKLFGKDLSPFHKKRIQELHDDYVSTKFKGTEAGQKAVLDIVSELEGDYDGIVKKADVKRAYQRYRTKGDYSIGEFARIKTKGKPKTVEVPEAPEFKAPTKPKEKKELPSAWETKTLEPMELPEIVRLAKGLLDGKYPEVRKKIGRKVGTAGRFVHVDQPVGVGHVEVHAALGKDAMQAANVLAHEIGHVVDWLPERDMKRGNILGRVASLKNWLKHTIGRLPATPDEFLSKKDRYEIRKKARKEAAKDFPDKEDKDARAAAEKDYYKEFIEEAIGERDLITRQQIHEELEPFTIRWKPFDPNVDAEYTKYRFKPTELYADALSALITNPPYLKKHAPIFYNMVMDYIERKAEVKEIWDSIQADIKSGDIHKIRDRALRKGFAEREREWSDMVRDNWENVKNLDAYGNTFIDRAFAVQRRVRKVEGNIPDHLNPRYKISDNQYSMTENEGYLSDFTNNILKPLEDAGLDQTDLGVYLYHRRVVGDRSDKLNPEGFTSEISGEKLAEIDKKWPVLKKLGEEFNQVRDEWLTGKEEFKQMYSPELIKYIEENPDYAKFDIVGFADKQLGGEASGKIFRQIGTFRSVGNPLVATVLNDLKLMRALNRNVAVKSIADTWFEHFPDQIEKAKTRWVTNHREVVFTKELNKDTLIWMDAGKVKGAYVDKYIAESVNKNPVEGWLVAQILRATAIPFKQVFTQKNPWFQMFNIIRDYKSAAKQLPKAKYFNKWTIEYLKAYKSAFRSVYNIPDPTIKEMLKNKSLISVVDYRGDSPQDLMLERLLKRYHIMPSRWNTGITKPFAQLFYHIDNIGKGIERVPKVAGHRWLTKHFPDMSDEAKAWVVRKRSGSPAFLHQGTASPLYNNLLLFLNAQKEGYRATIETIRERPGEWTYKTVKYNLIPKILMIAGMTGLLGKDSFDMYQRVTEYDMTNYLIVPLGMTPKGKTVYLRIPQDEQGRLISGIFYKTFRKEFSPTKLLDYMQGQAPTISPFWTVLWAVVEYNSGLNPYDHFRGRHVIPKQVFAAGGKRSHKYFAKWLANSVGGNIIHKFGYDDRRSIENELEALLKMPGFSASLGRFLKITDYGIKEKVREDWKKIESVKAETSLKAQDAFVKMVNGELPTAAEQEAFAIYLMNSQKSGLPLPMMKTLAYKYGDTWIQLILEANSKEKILKVFEKMYQSQK
jgi:hypothetical protein